MPRTRKRESTGSTTLPGKGENLIHEAREKGQHLLADAREKGETLLEDARERGESLIDDVRHRGDAGADEGDNEAHFTAEGITSEGSGITSTQHEDLGGVSPMGNVAAASLSSMDAVYDERSAGSMDDDDGASEAGTGAQGDRATSDVYGSESGAMMDEEETSYAGQAVSESDIGIDRGDSVSDLADSGEIRGFISDEIDLSPESGEGPYAATDEDEDGATWVEVEEPNLDQATAEAGYDATWVADQVEDEDEDERG